ncbi:hypothetical protein [Williamsia sp. Leaf354]|jgi:hypothetical protein|uniref:hypothetical protein n=1 Tax=Williamsia sp. Leaf354 TaxID=1736349 RepID=UPI000A62D53E|nr:hypothetical protein [Williamsia sp. Leaf354]
MSAILRSRRTLVPLAAAAAAGAILLPAAIPASAASGFATQVVSESQALVGSATNTVVTSAASLLAETPTLLRTLPLNDTASIVAAPANRALLGPALAAASDPTADLIAALQSAITKLGTALSDAPRNLIITGGQLLDGNVRAALQTFSNILIQPLVLIGLLDLPNIASASAQLNPFLAPVFNALPNIAINIVVTAIQLFTNAREGVATIYEGIRDGLKAGDIGAAGAAITTGISNILAQGNTDLFGENGVIAALKQSGDDFLNALGQLGKPAPTDTNTLRAASTAAVAPSAESTTPATEASAPTEIGSTSSKAAATSTVTAPATTAPAATTPATSKPETSTPETTTPAPSTSGAATTESTSTGSAAGSTPVATQSDTAGTTSGTGTSGASATGSTATATSPESAAPAASKAGAAAPAAASASE